MVTPAVQCKPSPQGGLRSRRDGLGTDADHAWCVAVLAELASFEEEVHAARGPARATSAVAEQACAAEAPLQLGEEAVESVEVVAAGHPLAEPRGIEAESV